MRVPYLETVGILLGIIIMVNQQPQAPQLFTDLVVPNLFLVSACTCVMGSLTIKDADSRLF